MAIYKSSELEDSPTRRVSTGIYDLDYLFGESEGVWGLPKGKITLLIGQSGVGKTRLLVEILKNMAPLGPNIIFMQGELGLASFATEKMGGWSADNVLLTDDVDIETQVKYIEKYKPSLMIVDSAQQMDTWAGGRGSKAIVRAYRDVIEKTGTHIILVSQMNRDGSTKGGTEIGHEVDLELFAVRRDEPYENQFKMWSEKNRYGKTGRWTIWEHDDHGVKCVSKTRLQDYKYLETRDVHDTEELTDRLKEVFGMKERAVVVVKGKSGLRQAWDSFWCMG